MTAELTAFNSDPFAPMVLFISLDMNQHDINQPYKQIYKQTKHINKPKKKKSRWKYRRKCFQSLDCHKVLFLKVLPVIISPWLNSSASFYSSFLSCSFSPESMPTFTTEAKNNQNIYEWTAISNISFHCIFIFTSYSNCEEGLSHRGKEQEIV